MKSLDGEKKINMKKGMDRYATQNRFKQKGYLRKYQNRSQGWEARKTSRCNCVQCRGKSQEEVQREIEDKILRDLIISSATPSQISEEEFRLFNGLLNQKTHEEAMQYYGKHVVITEELEYIGENE